MTYDELDSLESTDLRDFREARRIDVTVQLHADIGGSREFWYGKLTVTAETPAIVVLLKGPSATLVDGLMEQLRRILMRGRRSPAPRWVIAAVPFWLLVPASFLTAPLLHALGYSTQPDITNAEVVALALSFATAIALSAVTFWVWPALEFLESGGRPRIRRFGWQFFSLALVPLAVGLITAFVAGS